MHQADAGMAIHRDLDAAIGADLPETTNIVAQLLGWDGRVLDEGLGLTIRRDRLEQRHTGLAHLEYGVLLLGADRARELEIQLVIVAQVPLQPIQVGLYSLSGVAEELHLQQPARRVAHKRREVP